MKGSPRNGSGVASKPPGELREPVKVSVSREAGGTPRVNTFKVRRHKGQGGKRG